MPCLRFPITLGRGHRSGFPFGGFPLLWPLQHSHLHAHGNKLLAIVEVGERFEGSLDRSILLTFKLNYLLMNFKIKFSIKVKQVAQ